MSKGYTLQLRDINLQADTSNPGVRLGRACIERGIPVVKVAEVFKVSRSSVYNWFAGVTEPRAERAAAVEEFLASLQDK